MEVGLIFGFLLIFEKWECKSFLLSGVLIKTKKGSAKS